MILVIGGSGSGKSAYAEQIAMKENVQKYYLATMQIWDEEGQKKAERHRQLRKGKGFWTIERPTAVHLALTEMKARERLILLECISNLTANEMFSGEEPKTAMQTVENVIRSVVSLKEQATRFIVVSNNVFEDGMSYDETTMEYIRAMGEINRELAAMAGQVVEVVAGIPVILKQEQGSTGTEKGWLICGQ